MTDTLKYLLTCVEQHADKFPVPKHMMCHVDKVRLEQQKIAARIATLEAQLEEMAGVLVRCEAYLDYQMPKDMEPRCMVIAALTTYRKSQEGGE